MANTTDKSILTAAGKALLAQLNAEEKALIIDKMIFANVPNRTDLPQPDDKVPSDSIVHEEGVEQRGRLSADSVIYSTTLTSDVGPFEFNWTGAYCSEYDVLVTIDHHALTPKSADEPGVAGNTLVRSVVLEYKDIAEITNITVDASSWQYNATPRMKKMDNDVAQAIIDQNGKDWFIEDGFLVTPQGSAFNIKAGAGYVSGNRVTLEFDRNVQVPNKPSFIYVDAHREGTPTGEQVTLFDFVVTAEEKDDYTDANGLKHFVCKIAQVLGDGGVVDYRSLGASNAMVKSAVATHVRSLSDRFGDAINVKDFGALGDLFLPDGTLNPNATDNADAFQAAADAINLSVWNGTETIRIPVGAYGIGREVDLGRANLSGEGFNRTRKAQIMPLDPNYEGKLFIWGGAVIENISFKGWQAPNSTCIWIEGGYNRQIRNCEIGSFYYGIYVETITVQFSVKNCTFHGGEYVFYCEDKLSQQSTTTYFDNCMWQWCNNAVVFERDVFGSEFTQCIFENVKGSALKASWWGTCKFDTIWWEGRQTDAAGTRDIVEATINSGFNDCTAVNLYPREPWINNFSRDTVDSANALTQSHGITLGKETVKCRHRLGASTNLGNDGHLHFDADAWSSFRGLKLSTRNAAPASGRVRHIDICPGNHADLYIGSNEEGSSRAPIIHTQINDLLTEDGEQVFLQSKVTDDNYQIRHESKPLAPGDNTERRYDIAQVFLWDSTDKFMPKNLGAFTLTLESEGVIVLDAGRNENVYQAQEIFQPAVEVSGVFSDDFLLHRVVAVSAYSGGWGAYRAAQAIKIYFVNMSGDPVTPSRFTLTLRNRFY